MSRRTPKYLKLLLCKELVLLEGGRSNWIVESAVHMYVLHLVRVCLTCDKIKENGLIPGCVNHSRMFARMVQKSLDSCVILAILYQKD